MKVRASFPKVRLGYGSSVGLIEDEAARADIVFHTSASDEDVPSAEATSLGLGLAAEFFLDNYYGKRYGHVYDDWSHVHELISRPDEAPHAKVDHLELAESDTAKVAVVSPAAVYGDGRGPDKKTPFPFWTPFLEHKQLFLIGKGDNIWHYVHNRDLPRLCLLLAEDLQPGKRRDITLLNRDIM